MAKKILSQRLFLRVAGIVPTSVVSHFGRKLKFAGIRKEPKVWIGEILLFSAFLGLLSLLMYLIIYQPALTAGNAGVGAIMFGYAFLTSIVLFYIMLYLRITDRASAVEKILPDFLLLTVSNLRAGMPPFSAFVHAAKPEFGALYQEVRFSTAKAGGTASLVDALTEITEYFDSQILQRTVSLFAKGIRSGGQLAKLLNSSAEEVRRIQDLRAELASSTRTYTIFLGFIIILVMPFLLSVSTQFVTVFLALQPEDTEIDIEGMSHIPSFSGKVLITPEEMVTISIATLLITSLLVSGLAGIIAKGRPLYGVKYFPLFAVASIVVYFLARAFIDNMFSAFALT